MARGTAGFIGNEPVFQGGPGGPGGIPGVNLPGVWTIQEAYQRRLNKVWTSFLPALGDPFEGGFFAGLISHTADGNPTHALIVAPRATGATGTGYTLTTNLQWKTSQTITTNTTSDFDGVANTAAMVTAGIAIHPAAEFCVNLSIGGFTDWYLPARYELDIAYQLLKPTTNSNNTSFGINPYSVPERTVNRTAGDPAQTSITAFQSTGSEPFVDDRHWSSTEGSASTAWRLRFDNGDQIASGITGGGTKTSTRLVRAFRRVELYP
jgi:hypothetical protein